MSVNIQQQKTSAILEKQQINSSLKGFYTVRFHWWNHEINFMSYDQQFKKNEIGKNRKYQSVCKANIIYEVLLHLVMM